MHRRSWALMRPTGCGRDPQVGLLAAAQAAGPSTQTPYSRVGEAVGTQGWQTVVMKTLLTAAIVLFAGAIVIQSVPQTDLVPSGVRAVLDGIAGIW